MVSKGESNKTSIEKNATEHKHVLTTEEVLTLVGKSLAYSGTNITSLLTTSKHLSKMSKIGTSCSHIANMGNTKSDTYTLGMISHLKFIDTVFFFKTHF